MTIVLAVALCCGFGVWVLRETLPLIRERFRLLDEDRKDRLDLLKREVAVKEWEMRLKEQTMTKPDKREVMPADLVGRITKWDDDWAQDDERRYILELYAELGSWDAVRTALRPLDAEVQT